MYAEKLITVNPAHNMQTLKRNRKLPIILSENEVINLIQKAYKNYENAHENKKISCFRLYAILEILYSTGLRISELLGLKVKSLENVKDKFYIQGKGGSQRMIVFNQKSIEVLKQWLEIRKYYTVFQVYHFDTDDKYWVDEEDLKKITEEIR